MWAPNHGSHMLFPFFLLPIMRAYFGFAYKYFPLFLYISLPIFVDPSECKGERYRDVSERDIDICRDRDRVRERKKYRKRGK